MQFIAPDCKVGSRLFARRRGHDSPDRVFRLGCRLAPLHENQGEAPMRTPILRAESN